MDRLRLEIRDQTGTPVLQLSLGDAMAVPVLDAIQRGGTIRLHELASGVYLAEAEINTAVLPLRPARAFPGSGDPGDPGLGKPATVETDGPAGPSEG